VLADRFVRWPVHLLAILGAVLGNHTSTTETEAADVWLLDSSALVANAVASLFGSCVSRSGVIVGGSGSGVSGSHWKRCTTRVSESAIDSKAPVCC